MLPVLIIIGVIVVVGGIAAGVVSGYRSRAAKSDWLGELSDIRRSSLGDDEEVTGALDAIHVDGDEDGPADGSDLVSDVIPVVDVVAWPEPESAPESEAEPEAGSNGDVESASESEVAPESGSEGDVESAPESETAPESEAAPAVEPESDPESETAPVEEATSVAEADPEVESTSAVESAPAVETSPAAEADPEVESTPAVETAPDAEFAPADEIPPAVESESEPEPDREVGFADTAARSSSAATVSNLRAVTDAPNRTAEDAGTSFREYDRPGGSLLRIESSDPEGLRVLIGGSDASRATCAIDLPRGVLWHLAAQDVVVEACSIRTPAGWVTTTGTLLVLVDDTGWSYAMCLDGVATVEVSTEGRQARLEAGHIGRGRNGTVGFELANVGAEALESEGAVRRQRRLDHTDSVGD